MTYRPLSMLETATRIRSGEEPWLCVREFLDDFRATSGPSRTLLLAEEPPAVGDERLDAYLAALAEHLALHEDLPVPAWVTGPTRFLDRWWFPTSITGLHATCLVESPASFRRRGIFVDHTELLRC